VVADAVEEPMMAELVGIGIIMQGVVLLVGAGLLIRHARKP
jgi:hypothetical protein